MRHFAALVAGLSLVAASTVTVAQSTDGTAAPEAEVTEAVATDGGGESTEGVLTQAELEKLMAPVALYPDTLLIQILVAATYPLQVVKSDQFLADNPDMETEALKAEIEAQGWDPSVAVLAEAFPTVTADMAANLDWTETVGDAMIVQSDDVLAAVQTLRDQAIETGALVSGEAQTVETDEEDNVVITPTNPEVVYVPEYDSNVVYDNSVGDALAAGAIAFGTFVILDAIFNDDDYWRGYWGCRNCAGWGGQPIIRNPRINTGDINIGNEINRPDRPNRPEDGWKPKPEQRDQARDRLEKKKGDGGAAALPAKDNRGDQMRQQLSSKSGTADISRPENRGNLPQVDRPSSRPAGDKARAVDRTSRPAAGGGGNRQNVQKPAAKRPATQQKPQRNNSAVKRHQSGGKARASSNRGGGSRGQHRSRR